jgi:hypothetical protein
LPTSPQGTKANEVGAEVLLAIRREFGKSLEWLLTGRVDGVEIADELVLVELELIEPEPFFRVDEHAAQRFADAIVKFVGIPGTQPSKS